MPESRKRPGHPYQKPADIPSKVRTRGYVTWAILFGIFGLLIAWFAGGNDVVYLLIGTVVGAVIGYFIGKRMEKDA
jgi:uncharacterized membrane protein YfcA